MSEEAKTNEVPEEVPVEAKEEQVEENEETKVSVEEAEAKTGIKEDGVNEDAVKKAEGGDEPDKVALPSFFVEEEDSFKIEVDILFEKETGKLVTVSRSGMLDPDTFQALGFTQEWFKFHPIGYEEMTNYRQRCSTYRRDAGRALVDPIALRNYFIVWHLKDWSIRDRNNNKIELKFNERGALDDESIKMVYKCNTTMLDVVLTLFEKDMML